MPEQAALERGLLPDDETLRQLALDPELHLGGQGGIDALRWPEEPLRFVLIRARPQSPQSSPLILHLHMPPLGLIL